MEYFFRKAQIDEQSQIWDILKSAIRRRKEEGSDQWQDGYPNPSVIKNDIEKGVGQVLLKGGEIVGYCAVLVNDEPAYADIKGRWLTDNDFVVLHRVAIADKHLGKGLAQKMLEYIEDYASDLKIYSVRADTNFDNPGMLRVLEKAGYQYCGEVVMRGSPRKAFEKLLHTI